MFGTSGIRGIYGKDITEELASRMANLFADGTLTVGRDTRGSGPALFHALAAGALSNGSDVIDCGIVPTPTLALVTRDRKCRGIMITASHNPEEYNGMKFLDGGKEIDKKMEKELTLAYGKGERKLGSNSANGERNCAIYTDMEAVQRHIDLIMGLVDTEAIRKRAPKVIVDCNGAASVITPYLLTSLGCKVTSMNCSLSGFARPSEPNSKNLEYLSAIMKRIKADFAIAHDGDGDRCVIVDETGEVLQFDAQLAMMIEHELEGAGGGKGKRVISTVEASLTIRDAVEKLGGKIDITPVGSTFIGDLMEENGAVFGGEPCGEYIYRDGVHVPDAVLAAAKFAEIFCGKGKFSELKTRYPQHFMAREKFVAKDKQGTVEKVRGNISIKGEIRSDDGVRVDEEDGWFLVRASGTEPIVRLTMEYLNKSKLEKRKKEITALIVKSL